MSNLSIIHARGQIVKTLVEPNGPDSHNWRDLLIISGKTKAPRPCLENAITALRYAPEFRGVLRFNIFALRTVIDGLMLWTELTGDEWTTIHDIALAAWLQRHDVIVSPYIAGQAVERVAHERRFHPVLEYLERCVWDGLPRLDLWPVTYLGCEDTPYVRAVGAKWLISAVARIYEPGCKADCALILESDQGSLKSTALRTLSAPWFADELAEMGSKDAAIQLAGKWIIELAELDNIARADVSRIKAFMSRPSDWYRPPYERRAVDQPRQCVFAGTVNHSEYLRDETGARRFWPLACTHIDIDALTRDRDQLWAEARTRYLEGENWWLDNAETVEDAEEQQEARFQSDAWDDPIGDYIANRAMVTIGEILKEALFITTDKMSQLDQNRVARCLRLRKWKRKRVWDPVIQKQKWRYVKPSSKMAKYER